MDALGDAPRFGGVGTLHQDYEFITTNARDKVLGTADRAHGAPDERDQLVTDGMTERVVEELEVIHIKHDQSRRSGHGDALTNANEPFLQVTRVWEPSQQVVPRIVLGALEKVDALDAD